MRGLTRLAHNLTKAFAADKGDKLSLSDVVFLVQRGVASGGNHSGATMTRFAKSGGARVIGHGPGVGCVNLYMDKAFDGWVRRPKSQ
jgi:hypothetical protein